MKLKSLLAVALLGAVLLPAGLASAHQREVYKINGKQYVMVIGSLNEPVFVDDKTGLDFRVKLADPKDPTNSNAVGAKPVLGLEKSLKLEMLAGDKKQTVDIAAAHGDPGAYKTSFYPTIATAITYRVFGTIDGTPVDFMFACNPAGHPASPEDKTEIKLSDTVSRTYKNGAFGCFKPKADAQFPEKSLSEYELTTAHDAMMNMGGGDSPMATVALVLSVLALALVIISLVRGMKKPQV